MKYGGVVVKVSWCSGRRRLQRCSAPAGDLQGLKLLSSPDAGEKMELIRWMEARENDSV